MKESKAGETEVEQRTGRHRTRSEREQLVEAYRASGQTQAVFARDRGIKLTTLLAWIYRRRAEDHAGPDRAGAHRERRFYRRDDGALGDHSALAAGPRARGRSGRCGSRAMSLQPSADIGPNASKCPREADSAQQHDRRYHSERMRGGFGRSDCGLWRRHLLRGCWRGSGLCRRADYGTRIRLIHHRALHDWHAKELC